MKRTALLLPLLLVLACTDSDLKKVANSLKITAESIGVVQSTVIEANRTGLMSEDDTRRVLELCVKVNKAGQDASAVTRNLAKLDSTDRTQVLAILKPIITAVADALKPGGLFGDSNSDAKRNIRNALLTIQTALNSVQIVLAAS